MLWSFTTSFTKRSDHLSDCLCNIFTRLSLFGKTFKFIINNPSEIKDHDSFTVRTRCDSVKNLLLDNDIQCLCRTLWL